RSTPARGASKVRASESDLLKRSPRPAQRCVEPVRSLVTRGDRLVEELLTLRPDANLRLLERGTVAHVDRPLEPQRLGNLVRDFPGQREDAGYQAEAGAPEPEAHATVRLEVGTADEPEERGRNADVRLIEHLVDADRGDKQKRRPRASGEFDEAEPLVPFE